MQNRVLRGSQITVFKRSALKLAVVAAFALGGVTSALAGSVGGNVAPINELTQNPVSNITIVAATAQSDTTIVTGTIDNNFDKGWKLTVASTNLGKLKRGTGGDGREILYTNVKFVKGTGTLGTGLIDPSNVDKSIVSGTAIFNTGATEIAPGTATTATVACAYALKISWPADTKLLSGAYTDTITLTLADDSI